MGLRGKVDEFDSHQLCGWTEVEILEALELGGAIAIAFERLTLKYLEEFEEYRKIYRAMPPEMMIVRAGTIFEKLAVRQMVEIYRSSKH